MPLIESPRVSDSRLHAVDSADSRYWIPVFVSGFFWILISSGIVDTLSCIQESTSQDSGLDNKIFPGFWIPQAKISRIVESGFLYQWRLLNFLSCVLNNKTTEVVSDSALRQN